MTVPINMTLYRYLVKHGADEAEAQEAATIDASALATKADVAGLRADLRADLAELKADLYKHTTQTLIWVTAVFGIIVSIVAAITRLFT